MAANMTSFCGQKVLRKSLVSCGTYSRRPLLENRNIGVSFLSRRTVSSPSDLPAPPLLLKLKSDLKDAMRNKDTNRLNVLRGVIAEVTNAAKTSSPYKTDVQLLSLLRKRASASRAAAEEFSSANRTDLKDKEMAQVSVMEEYASGVETMSEEDLTAAIQETLGQLRTDGKNVQLGDVLKTLMGPEGALAGKPVEGKEVARLVKGML